MVQIIQKKALTKASWTIYVVSIRHEKYMQYKTIILRKGRKYNKSAKEKHIFARNNFSNWILDEAFINAFTLIPNRS